jgi:methionine synthase I (cobalamin-dependent)
MKVKGSNNKIIKSTNKPITLNSSSIKKATVKRAGGCCGTRR